MKVRFNNPSLEGNAITYMTSKAAATATTLTVRDTTGFSANDFVVIGQMGQEGTEIKKIASVDSSTQFTVAATVHDHPQGAPVTFISVDKVAFQYKTSASGSATDISGMPIAIQADRNDTAYDHNSGESTYYYRARYYNSQLSAYGGWSVWFPASGLGRNTLMWMTDRVLKLVRDPDSKIFTRTDVRDALNGVQEDIAAQYDRWFFLRVKDDTSMTTTASDDTIALPSDFQRMDRLDYHYNDGSNEYIYPLRYLTPIEFQALVSDQDQSDDDDLAYYTMLPGDDSNPQGYVQVYPTPETAGLYLPIIYYKKMADLSDPDDTTDVTIPNALVYGAVAELLLTREGKEKLASFYEKKFEKRLGALKRLQKRTTNRIEGIVPRGGHRGAAKFYGERRVLDIDTLRTNYW